LGYLETADGVIGWGNTAVEGQVAMARGFILTRTPRSTPMGVVQWMSHQVTLDCQTGMLTQNAVEYLALDGTSLGKSLGRPPRNNFGRFGRSNAQGIHLRRTRYCGLKGCGKSRRGDRKTPRHRRPTRPVKAGVAG
jgi:hypothetical protein